MIASVLLLVFICSNAYIQSFRRNSQLSLRRLVPSTTKIRGASTESENLLVSDQLKALVNISPDVLDKVGEEIIIAPPVNGITRVVMKFGGSSLATPERITYVSK